MTLKKKNKDYITVIYNNESNDNFTYGKDYTVLCELCKKYVVIDDEGEIEDSWKRNFKRE